MNDYFNQLIDKSEEIIHSRFGIIREARRALPLPGSPPFFHYQVKTASTKAFCDQKNFQNFRGVAITPERAYAKAIGEGIERYCSAIYNKNNLKLFSFNEANFKCANPKDFPKHSALNLTKKYYKYENFFEHSKIRWAKASTLTNNNSECYIPASLVYLPYIYGENEKRIYQNISTGLACHQTFELATITAICEVVERDAFMIFWRNKLSPPKIKTNNLPKQVVDIISNYQKSNLDVELFNITTDIKIPTVLATMKCNIPGNPPLIISGSCKTTFASAILSALEELELTRSYCLTKMFHHNSVHCEAESIKTQDDHLDFWFNTENQYLADFLFESKTEFDIYSFKSFPTDETEILDQIIDIFCKSNIKVFISDITTIDIKDYFFVVRAVIPDLHPLAFGYKNDEFVCSRINSVPKFLGYCVDINNLNRYIPHPFP
jgi:ribosomal protein S12 methylthiotransferase accessory factor